jgi:hypothetical protein
VIRRRKSHGSCQHKGDAYDGGENGSLHACSERGPSSLRCPDSSTVRRPPLAASRLRLTCRALFGQT